MSRRGRDMLSQVPLFATLSARRIRGLAALAEEQRFMEGAKVVREGEVGDTFYVILEGEAKVVSRAGRVLNRLYPGQFFGEISLMDGGPRTATVEAVTPLSALALPRSAFIRLIQQDPGVGVTLLRYTATLLRRLERSASG